MAPLCWLCSISLPFLIVLSVMVTKSTSEPTYVCPDTTTILSPNSRYQNNLELIFFSLSSNAASNPNSFFNTSYGNGTETVYGLYLCRGDQDISSCKECVTMATKDLPNKYCPNRKEAVIWYDQCMVRYSDESFFGRMDQFPSAYIWNTDQQNSQQNAYLSADPLFEEILDQLMKNVSNAAATVGYQKKFATDKYRMNSKLTLYGLGHCTPDLSASDCHMCLTTAIGQLPRDFNDLPTLQGARVLQPSCSVRYETYPFFNGIVHTPLSASPDASAHAKKLQHWIPVLIAIPTFIAITFADLGVWTCIYKGRASIEITKDNVRTMQFDLRTIRIATCNFSVDNKLGEGGFGEVYKGILEDGQEVAVKRLSRSSKQGFTEFKTEVLLVAKLQHKNLVKLLGFCLASNAKIIVYEYLQNSSLDKLLFDSTKKLSLDWEVRFKVIAGIAGGLMYLHEDSRLKVIHRDLKPSNILLDDNMNPKISDFGLAKLLDVDQSQGATKRIVGTYGYMAPEYVTTGRFSIKSDVYSFGVLVLEVVSGQKNKFFDRSQLEEALLLRAWRLWSERDPLQLLDPSLGNNYPKEEVTKCIHIGLLCVQEDAADRPRMETVIAALSGQSVSLQMPKIPTWFGDSSNTTNMGSTRYRLHFAGSEIEYCQVLNQHGSPCKYSGSETITDLYPR